MSVPLQVIFLQWRRVARHAALADETQLAGFHWRQEWIRQPMDELLLDIVLTEWIEAVFSYHRTHDDDEGILARSRAPLWYELQLPSTPDSFD